MYKKFYGFSEDPFALTPDPKFLYLALGHWKALSSMMSGIKEKKRLIVITGEVGVGKTILIHALLKDLTEKIKTAFIFNPKLDFKNLLKTILQDLEIPLEGKEEDVRSLMLQFNKYLQERLARDEIVTVIIDESQALEEKVLEEVLVLATLDIPAGKALQVLLVGQPELEEKLNSPKLRHWKHKIAIHGQVRPLTREEGRGYVRHRLKLVGRSVSEVFTSEAINRIWEFAGGIPRVINLICDRSLLIGYTNSSPMIDSKIADQALQDFKYLKTPKSKILRPLSFLVKSRYGVGILVLLLLSLGVFAFFHYDFSPTLWKPTGKIPLPEQRPPEKRREAPEVKRIPPPAGEVTIRKGEAVTEVKKDLPPPGKRPMPKPPEQAILVEEGWTLTSIARQYFSGVNHSLLDFMLEANPEITDIHLIFSGQKIRIPHISEETLLLRVSNNRYQIYLGTFATAEEARRYKDEPVLKEKSLKAFSRRVSPRETWYRIIVGPYQTREEALEFIQTLKAKKLLPLLDCLPRKAP
jgi:general secretion pathway protein A